MNFQERFNEDTTYTSVPVSIANKLKKANNLDIMSQAVNDYVKKQQKEFSIELEALDDDLIRYKALLIEYNKKIKAAYNEQRDKIQTLFHDFESQTPRFSEQVKKTCEEINPLLQKMEEIERTAKSIDTTFNNLSTYKIEKLIEVIEKLSGLDEKTLKLIKFFNE